MSKQPPHDLIIQWSTRGVTVYDGRTRSVSHALEGFRGRTAILALSRRSVFVKSTRLPNAAREDVRQILALRIADLFPLPAASLAYDYWASEDVNEAGRLCMVGAAVATDLRAAREQIASAGITIARTVPLSLGSAFVAGAEGLSECAVVQQTDEGVAIDIISHGLVAYSRVSSPSGEISADVCRTFTVAGIPCSDIVAAGGISFPDSDRTTAHDSLERLVAHPLPEFNIELPEMVAARAAAKRSGRNRMALLMALAAVGLGAVAYTDWSDANAKVEHLRSSGASKQRRLESIQKAKEADALTATALQSGLKRAFDPAQSIPDIIQAAGNRVPEGLWVSGLSVERGKEIQIRGVAKSSQSVSVYAAQLQGSNRFRDVRIQSTSDSKIEDTPVVQFSISAFPIGNLPLDDPNADKKAVKK